MSLKTHEVLKEIFKEHNNSSYRIIEEEILKIEYKKINYHFKVEYYRGLLTKIEVWKEGERHLFNPYFTAEREDKKERSNKY